MSTLVQFPDVIQGSDEWHDHRRGLVTASTVGQLVTPSTLKVANNDKVRGLTALLVAERITGYTDPTYIGDDMLRGIEDEAKARDLYAETTRQTVREVGFMIRNGDGWTLGYSPDGVIGDRGLIEVKAPRAKGHLRTILGGQVPAEYTAQCQAALLVSGREWIDYVSYSGGMPMWWTRVLPDPVWHEAMIEALIKFQVNAGGMIRDYFVATAGLPATERTIYQDMVI